MATNLIDGTTRAGSGRAAYRVKVADLVAVGDVLSGDIYLTTVPAGTIVKYTLVKTVTAVTGATTAVGYVRTTSPAVDFGTTTYNLKTAVSDTNYDLYGTSKYFPTAADVYFHYIVTVEHAKDTTAGEILIYLDEHTGYVKS